MQSREKIKIPEDWPGLEKSDLDSDAIRFKSPVHDFLLALHCGCFGLIAIVAILLWLASLFKTP